MTSTPAASQHVSTHPGHALHTATPSDSLAAMSASPPAHPTVPAFVWLEITGKCQLNCTHCYAGSSPAGRHGTLTVPEWEHVISSTAASGVQMVQFIGGEPTLHPALPHLINHALDHGLRAEVFTNLVHLTPALWAAFTQPGVSLATSWYTDDPAQHQQITGRNTHARTWTHITECVRRGVPLRAGVITSILAGQRDREALAMLAALGIPASTDHLRDLGRGSRPDPTALCGGCGDKVACIGPDGTVHPCPMARWVNAGHVRDGVAAALTHAGPAALAAGLPRTSPPTSPAPLQACGPDTYCDPNYCNPKCVPSLRR